MVGLLLAGLAGYLATQGDADAVSHQYVRSVDRGHIALESQDMVDELVRLGKTDHVALLEMCLENVKRYKDYEGTFIKQERIDGALRDEQVIKFHHRTVPFSVAMAWEKNAPRGDRILYVDGRNNNEMFVRVNLPLLRGMVVSRDPAGQDVMRNTLNPVTRFGFQRGLENLVEVYREAKEVDDLRIEFGGFTEVFGSKCVRLLRYLPLKGDYPAKLTEIHIDVETLLPVCIKGFDWDDQLTSKYIYRDLRFNVGLNDENFTKAANGM
jgi:hypothetical protein